MSNDKFMHILKSFKFSAKNTCIGAGAGSIPYLYLNNDITTLRSIAITFTALFIIHLVKNRKE